MDHTVVEVAVRTPVCLWCKMAGEVFVPLKGFQLYKNGMHIQNALPELSAGLREQILTGTHPDCWDEMMPEEDEEDDLDGGQCQVCELSYMLCACYPF